MSKSKIYSDPRFHYEILKEASLEYEKNHKSISYVENNNASCGYSELAIDFGMAADALIEEYHTSGISNWISPVAHISRQVIELHLKALMHSINNFDTTFDVAPLNSHSLETIWLACRDWLISFGYKVNNDARFEMTNNIITAYHEIAPSGDLFRFGISRRIALNKQKSCDRVSICLDNFEKEFKAAQSLLRHWEAVVFRESFKIEMGWENDPFFDPDNFPINS
ncbi:hypothetical protein [Aeromonas bestiarum]|uniref:hypothetical protein n=1 Tax=Aeromonas bestiarum TaxID=105751 RepID=UPI003D1EBBA3